MKFFSALTALAAFTTLPAHALTYKIDPVHTQVISFINHMGFSNSSGKFHVSEGTIEFDPANVAAASVQAKIDITSLDMNDARWQEHFSGERFFDVAKFPTAEFRSTKVDSVGEDLPRVSGELTLHGVTRPIVLTTHINKLAPHPMLKLPAAGFSATAHIKRSDFAITTALPMVSDDVEIRLEVEAHAGTAPEK